MAQRLASGLLCLGLGLLVGCGSSDAELDRGDPGATAQAYADALASEDAAAACPLVDVDLVRSACGGDGGEELVEGGSEVTYLGKVAEVDVQGSDARVDFTGGGFLDLNKHGDAWYVDLVR